MFDKINGEKEDSKIIEDENLFIKKESQENSVDAIVTMTDFREAYRNIKNRYS